MPDLSLGIVIRADGSVPFDADLHPDHKAAMIAHLQETGHEFEHQRDDDGNHFLVLTSGPHAPAP